MNAPPSLVAGEFAAFFLECWGYDPFPWQIEFARRACLGQWPGCVAVPTGSGKTACLDAAIFALAVQASLPPEQRTAGRRIFFIVNRRVIVDEAFIRAGKLAEHLSKAQEGTVTQRVAARLRHVAGGGLDTEPLCCAELRGGIYRDRAWAKSLLQPTIVCSTVDQTGSRLLFRGYGVTPSALPIHAALVAQDSVLIVDEAHISGPFLETLEWVRRYRQHRPEGSETITLPFVVVPMTATPPADMPEGAKVSLSAQDLAHRTLSSRLKALKLARLGVETKAKGKSRHSAMADRLVKEAEAILKDHKPRSIAIMVNRVETARQVAAKLANRKATLLIGRMRPLDRDAVTRSIQEDLKTGAAPTPETGEAIVVVSTQCLEVGADLDFDALVTEAASLDALRQRFGRLNRGGRDLVARAVIVLPGEQDIEEKKLSEEAGKQADPIYGNAVPRTWRFLHSIGRDGAVDFGIAAMSDHVNALTSDERARLFSPVTSAPVLLPEYLNRWVQTSPTPAADPDVALFLHGPQHDMAEVNVCWRADLPAQADKSDWCDILSFCPPCTPECLPVPLHVMRDWLQNPLKTTDDTGDAPQAASEDKDTSDKDARGVSCLRWRGADDSEFVGDAAWKLRPGDTLVLRAQEGGWASLGHIPSAPPDPADPKNKPLTVEAAARLDFAERAQAQLHRRACLRLHPSLRPTPVTGSAAGELMASVANSDEVLKKPELRGFVTSLLVEECGWTWNEDEQLVLRMLAAAPAAGFRWERYPDERGIFLYCANRIPPTASRLPKENTCPEDASDDPLLDSDKSQSLCDHTTDVANCLITLLAGLPLAPQSPQITLAAQLHDWGKADPRFQAMLRGSSVFMSTETAQLLAKSGSVPQSAAARKVAREKAGLPSGWRHEMTSLQLAAASSMLPADAIARALVLHLISSHHGNGRPFAPVVSDDAPPPLTMPVPGATVTLTTAERFAHPAHALDSGIAERFWQLTHHYGWWGLALLEATLRLADQEASAHPVTFAKP